MNATARQAATAHPSISQLTAVRGRWISETPTMPIATTGATTATASAPSMIGPIPGMTRMSNPENRININKHHTAAQMPRHQIDAVLREAFATCRMMPNAKLSGRPLPHPARRVRRYFAHPPSLLLYPSRSAPTIVRQRRQHYCIAKSIARSAINQKARVDAAYSQNRKTTMLMVQ